MTNHLSHQSIARDDVSLDNLTKTIEVIVADDQAASNSCTWMLLLLKNVNVHKVLLPEFPSQSDTILAASGRSKHIVSVLTFS